MNWSWIFRAVWMLCLGRNDMSRKMKESGIDWIGSIPMPWNTIKFKSNEPTDRLFYTA